MGFSPLPQAGEGSRERRLQACGPASFAMAGFRRIGSRRARQMASSLVAHALDFHFGAGEACEVAGEIKTAGLHRSARVRRQARGHVRPYRSRGFFYRRSAASNRQHALLQLKSDLPGRHVGRQAASRFRARSRHRVLTGGYPASTSCDTPIHGQARTN